MLGYIHTYIYIVLIYSQNLEIGSEMNKKNPLICVARIGGTREKFGE